MNKNKEKELFAEILADANITISSISEIKEILLNHEDIALQCSMAYFIAAYKISELQNDVIKVACSEKSKNHSAVFIYASHQFPCSQFFKVYIALILQRSYHSCLACFIAIKKCKNIPIEDLIYAKEVLQGWYYFYNNPNFADEETINKRAIVYRIWTYLKKRIIKEKGET